MAERSLQGEHSNHHPASAVPDREVKTETVTVAARTNPIAKTVYGDGTAQPDTTRDTDEPQYSPAAG